MTRVVVAPVSVAMFPEGGGHLWVFLQWIRGLQDNGCDVYWLECLESRYGRAPTAATVETFLSRMDSVGMAERTLVYQPRAEGGVDFVNADTDEALDMLGSTDLLVDFKYDTPGAILERFARTALVDIDPGLLQFWLSHGQLELQRHDTYFTTGENIGTERSPDCGIDWEHLAPAVHLPSWPFDDGPRRDEFTTVTNWFGEWLTDGADFLLDNSKRVEFLAMVDLPLRTSQPLELAVCFGDNEDDDIDRTLLLEKGWRVRHSFDVSHDPDSYRDYIRSSRGEFSCVKPSCLLFRNAWVSDRTLCYLASGRPAVIQHTGPSSFLPSGEGLLRFTTIDEAADALTEVNRRYAHHCRAARDLAEAHFDAKAIAGRLLDSSLSPRAPT